MKNPEELKSSGFFYKYDMDEITNKFGDQYRIKVKQTKDNISFVVIGEDGEVGHLVLKKEKTYLPIIDAYVDLRERGKGLWKNLMYYARESVKSLGYKGLFSAGQFRRPASDKSWKGIPDRKQIFNSDSHKLDYYLEHLEYFDNF